MPRARPDPWNVQAAVPVSAAKGWNLDRLLRKTESLLMEHRPAH